MSKPASQRRELERLKAMSDQDIDTSDLPERSDWHRAEVGKFYRPVKQQITLRIDADIIAWFKARGGKYQTAVNAALREYTRSNAPVMDTSSDYAAPTRQKRRPSLRKPVGTRASTGETCPESGVWKSEDTPSTTAPISKGNRMPPHNLKAVTWRLVRYA